MPETLEYQPYCRRTLECAEDVLPGERVAPAGTLKSTSVAKMRPENNFRTPVISQEERARRLANQGKRPHF